MVRLPTRHLRDRAKIRTYRGQGVRGKVLDPEVELWSAASGERSLVRNAEGEEVVSELKLLLPPAARLTDGSGVVDTLAVFAQGSEVEALGHRGQVVKAKPHTLRGKTVYVEVEVS